MKRNSIYIFSIIATAAVIASINLSNSDLEKAESERPQVLSMTASVEIPEEMTFAGEKIHFDRYDLRERMDRELNSFTYFHSTTMLLFKRANRIFPIIEPILKQEGVPDDLKYLAVIESSLDPRAVSPARATGLWQLLSGTAQELGLEVSSEVDERYHISKSTVAACRFLKDAYRRYGSWSAAVMSYNGGKARITSELSKQQAEEALDLWLVEETSRYYFRMMAIKSLFENPSKYGFILRGDQLYKPMEFKEVNVSTAIPNLASFARENGITYAQLKDFNSWLRDTKLTNKLGKTYTILIPTRESLYYKKGEKIKIHDKRWVTE
ncbi:MULTISPECIES: lytic transglycosylase domain-containing protein [Petrimonas]|jgi:membrane-bound lytic murein transglycosylase D|uniref:Putative tributyltin chloride resistance protein n=1 Tax=Petrimonas mucosa TaxID=1642646 RepID=A0A1G4GAE1_9BACT|nr:MULTISPECIES: lytic transglycosylase domain-containing protein [Petrimonas]MDD3560815.1 lytic transglycosylase domain-containing protein [Petrimonas mucosa]SCM59513.1 putative tributyltin chloride resistance protein [Petrimonas mucosa]SFU36555.1 Transglycosylase SLT domain-containing protein [Porphyromonadaceae bacterium KHP3R9]HHT29519.1 lytic transglycosylase domain-containing protein [Petrimonas mucosa]